MIDQEIQNLRTEQLDQLKIGVQEKGTSVVLVIGPEGIGKTSLINVLGSSLESSDEPFLWIDPNSIKSEEDLLKYPQLLSHSIQTNTPLLKGKVDQAAQELGGGIPVGGNGHPDGSWHPRKCRPTPGLGRVLGTHHEGKALDPS